ncbi:hypothetical protein BP6252_04936 [Coleophoma cylindrospora]|uniref:Uncharacterized protein n=1 Tax=Coleophoma cylindrospora TaxID=1849047 RepID=A0A3D8S203_9HELO|nr:hypothetical protein BP6252_04936 [Coleophoma cylindrospora]
MPASAVQTKTWFRPKGWFTDGEVAIVVNRVLRDDPSKGDMNNRQVITLNRLWLAAKDYNLWPIYLMGYLIFIPQSPVGTYLTLSLKNLGFSKFNINLLTIPSTILHIITMLSIAKISQYLDERTMVFGWLSQNSNNVGNRSVSTAFYNILSQLGTITSNYITVTGSSRLDFRFVH